MGLAAHSLGLISEALHSGTDLVAALLTFFAVGVAVRPADTGHPYGHGKAEHLAALGEAGILVVASLIIVWRALTRLFGSTHVHVHPAWYALAWPRFEVSTAAVYRAWDEVGGEGPNHLFRPACAVDPRLGEFAESLGEGWRMTGSGSAFFREVASEAEAHDAIKGREGWTAVAHSLDGV